MDVYCKKKSKPGSLAELRFTEFESKAVDNLRVLPPSRPGLIEHIKRSCYQAGWLWVLSYKKVTLPIPELFGWEKDGQGNFKPLWQRSHFKIDFMNVIKTCCCSKGTCKNCSCAKSKIQCLPFCSCRRRCISNV